MPRAHHPTVGPWSGAGYTKLAGVAAGDIRSHGAGIAGLPALKFSVNTDNIFYIQTQSKVQA
jgi:hypothetical protein